MNYIFIGEVVNTHGIKGELRIISNFRYKEAIFKKGQVVFLGSRKQKMIINSYRFHKIYDMVTFEGINDINEAIAFKGDKVYADRSTIDIDGFVDEDVIGCSVYDRGNLIGKVDSIMENPHHDILIVTDVDKRNLIPFISEFVKNVDIKNKRIDIESIEGLLNED